MLLTYIITKTGILCVNAHLQQSSMSCARGAAKEGHRPLLDEGEDNDYGMDIAKNNEDVDEVLFAFSAHQKA